MKINADRASGLLFLIFGISLYLFIIPASVEEVDGGWVLPDTIPNAIAFILGLCGLILVIRPTDHRAKELGEVIKAAIYFAVLMAGLLAISQFGFVYVAPILALVIMLMIGERRPFWLIAGAIGMPAAIWILVVQVLERALP